MGAGWREWPAEGCGGRSGCPAEKGPEVQVRAGCLQVQGTSHPAPWAPEPSWELWEVQQSHPTRRVPQMAPTCASRELEAVQAGGAVSRTLRRPKRSPPCCPTPPPPGRKGAQPAPACTGGTLGKKLLPTMTGGRSAPAMSEARQAAAHRGGKPGWGGCAEPGGLLEQRLRGEGRRAKRRPHSRHQADPGWKDPGRDSARTKRAVLAAVLFPTSVPASGAAPPGSLTLAGHLAPLPQVGAPVGVRGNDQGQPFCK